MPARSSAIRFKPTISCRIRWCGRSRKAHLYENNTNLRGWLVTIMHNEHVNSVRRSMRGAVLVSDEELGELGHTPTQEAPIELQEIRGAVQRLPQDQREPLLLHWLHGLKYEEIATQMNLPIGTVQSRISRARKAFARYDRRAEFGPRPRQPGDADRVHCSGTLIAARLISVRLATKYNFDLFVGKRDQNHRRLC